MAEPKSLYLFTTGDLTHRQYMDLLPGAGYRVLDSASDMAAAIELAAKLSATVGPLPIVALVHADEDYLGTSRDRHQGDIEGFRITESIIRSRGNRSDLRIATHHMVARIDIANVSFGGTDPNSMLAALAGMYR